MRKIIVAIMALTPVQAMAMEDLEKAAVYGVDKVACNLYVPQSWIDESLFRASVTYDLTVKETVLEAARIGSALMRDLKEAGTTARYCAARRMK